MLESQIAVESWTLTTPLLGKKESVTRDRRIVDLHDYWRKSHEDGRLPGRQHIDPLRFSHLWPWVWMIDVVRSPARFRLRLLGSEHARMLKGQHIGRGMEEIYPPTLCPAIHEGLADAAAGIVSFGRSPGCVRYDGGQTVTVSTWTADWLFLPLAGNGVLVDMLLGVVIPDKRQD